MKKSRHIIFSLLAVIIMIALASHAMDYNKAYQDWSGESIKQLNTRGRQLITANKPDSALVCFTLVSGKYTASLDRSDKILCSTALNNAAYIYFFYRNDYSSSYMSLLKSLEISEEVGDSTMLPYIYLNMGNIFTNYNDVKKATSLYTKAFHSAAQNANWDITLTTISNIVNNAIMSENYTDIDREVALFDRLPIPKATPMLQFTRSLCRAAMAIRSRQYDNAIRLLQDSKSQINTTLTPQRYVFTTDMYIAYILSKQKRYGESIATIRRGLDAGRKFLDLHREACNALSDAYAKAGQPDSAMKWHYMELQLSDSLFRSQQYGQIRDIESAYELKKLDTRMQQVENRRHTMAVALTIVGISAAILLVMAVMIWQKNRRLTANNQSLYRRAQDVIRLGESEQQLRIAYEQRMKEYERQLQQLKDAAQEKHSAEPRSAETKYSSSGLDDIKRQQLLTKIAKVLDNVDEISSTDFSIERLTRLVGSNTTYVSQVINETYGKNFNALLGETRVRLACKRLCDADKYGNLTIEAIAVGLGFKSRSNFVTVFKRVTGLTPSDYKKIGKDNNQ